MAVALETQAAPLSGASLRDNPMRFTSKAFAIGVATFVVVLVDGLLDGVEPFTPAGWTARRAGSGRGWADGSSW